MVGEKNYFKSLANKTIILFENLGTDNCPKRNNK